LPVRLNGQRGLPPLFALQQSGSFELPTRPSCSHQFDERIAKNTKEIPGMSEVHTRPKYSMSYAGFRWHMYDVDNNHLADFEGNSADAVTQAMRVVIDRGDFGTGDWFLAGHGHYEFRTAG
jgi:hypothetical protein